LCIVRFLYLGLVWKAQQRRLPRRRMPGVGARPASFQTETISGSSSTGISKLPQLGLHVLIKMGLLPVESLDDVF
jgi:hypothetical protein